MFGSGLGHNPAPVYVSPNQQITLVWIAFPFYFHLKESHTGNLQRFVFGRSSGTQPNLAGETKLEW